MGKPFKVADVLKGKTRNTPAGIQCSLKLSQKTSTLLQSRSKPKQMVGVIQESKTMVSHGQIQERWEPTKKLVIF